MTEPFDVRGDLARRVEMHRRRFLGLLAGGAGMVVLGACSGDDGGGRGDGGSDLDGSTGDSASMTAGPTTTPLAAPDDPGLPGVPFALGVASGDPLPDGVVLWTRLVVDPLAADGHGGLGPVADADVEVLWEVADDEGFGEVIASGIEVASPDFAHSVHVEVGGLEPDRRYHYRFRIGDRTSPVGRTRTAPAGDADVDGLTLAFASCQLRGGGHWTAYRHLAEDDVDLVLHLGDYVYEYPNPNPGEGADDLLVPLEGEPQTLADYRLLYGAYKRDERLRAAHERAPWIVTWDDHEVENNYAGSIPENDSDAATFAERRTAAYQAFWEHHPVRINPPDEGGLALHRELRFGNLLHLFVLDGRQHRTDQVCGDAFGVDANTCAELDDPENTMLGDEQERWLVEGLSGSTATWKGIAQQTVMKALVVGDVVLNVDQWDGYPEARARLLGAIADNGIDNVVVMTGDIHAGGAANLRGTDAGPDGPIVAHEIVCPAISSSSLADALGSDLDLTPFGLTYANLRDHGYVRARITPDRWTTEWVLVDTIAEPESAARVDATVEVRAGTPGLRVV
ncbi:MAG: alkaline phosphatase [Acidimicrobiales bacterium]|nr:alkaline phosphatase [Acidimicrobiales bacterium]